MQHCEPRPRARPRRPWRSAPACRARSPWRSRTRRGQLLRWDTRRWRRPSRRIVPGPGAAGRLVLGGVVAWRLAGLGELCLPLVHAVAGTQGVQVRRQSVVVCSSSGRQSVFVGRSGDCVTRLVGRQDLLRGAVPAWESPRPTARRTSARVRGSVVQRSQLVRTGSEQHVAHVPVQEQLPADRAALTGGVVAAKPQFASAHGLTSFASGRT